MYELLEQTVGEKEDEKRYAAHFCEGRVGTWVTKMILFLKNVMKILMIV
jgi:hypothetical protein